MPATSTLVVGSRKMENQYIVHPALHKYSFNQCATFSQVSHDPVKYSAKLCGILPDFSRVMT